MKLYAEYIKEREDIDCIFTDECFITFRKINKESIFVYDMFSTETARGKKIMLEFCKIFTDKMKEDGIKKIYGTTEENTNGWERSDKVLREFGFKFIGKHSTKKHTNNYCLEL